MVSGPKNMSSLLDGLQEGPSPSATRGPRVGKQSIFKDWRAIVSSVLLIGSVAFLAFWMVRGGLGGGGPAVLKATMLVDVSTGDLFEASLRRRGVVVPATNPKTGESTLFPVVKERDVWVVPQVFLETIRALDPKPTKLVVDITNGMVQVSSAPVSEYSAAALRGQPLGSGGGSK